MDCFQTSQSLLLNDLHRRSLRHRNKLSSARQKTTLNDTPNLFTLRPKRHQSPLQSDSFLVYSQYLIAELAALYSYSSQLKKSFRTKHFFNKQCSKRKGHVHAVVLFSPRHPSSSLVCSQIVNLWCLLSFSRVHMQPRQPVTLFNVRQNTVACSQQKSLQQAQSVLLSRRFSWVTLNVFGRSVLNKMVFQKSGNSQTDAVQLFKPKH